MQAFSHGRAVLISIPAGPARNKRRLRGAQELTHFRDPSSRLFQQAQPGWLVALHGAVGNGLLLTVYGPRWQRGVSGSISQLPARSPGPSVQALDAVIALGKERAKTTTSCRQLPKKSRYSCTTYISHGMASPLRLQHIPIPKETSIAASPATSQSPTRCQSILP